MGCPVASTCGDVQVLPTTTTTTTSTEPPRGHDALQHSREHAMCPADARGRPDWTAIPAGLVVRAVESLNRQQDVSSARLVCSGWRAALDGSVSALSPPTALPTNGVTAMAARFPGLTSLDLTRSTLPTTLLLPQLAVLTRLSSLTLPWGSCLGGSARLSALQRLTAKGAIMQGPDPLATFPCLTFLDLSHSVGAAAACQSARLSSLRELRLAGAGLSNEELTMCLRAGCYTNLKVLDISGNQCEVSMVVSHFPASLKRLSVEDGGRLGARSAAALSRLSALESLSLAGCELGDGGIVDEQFLGSWLGSASSLTVLDLSRCATVGDATVAALARLSCRYTLRTLRLAGCRLISDTGAAELSRLPALTDLDLDRCVKVTAAGISSLHDGHTAYVGGGLRSLRIGGLPKHQNLEQQPSSAPFHHHLIALYAPSCAALSARWLLGTVWASGHSLHTLDLRACTLPLDCLLQAAAPALKALQSVCLAESPCFHDDGVVALCAIPTLTSIDLSHCCGLRNGGAVGRLFALPRLESLVLRDCLGLCPLTLPSCLRGSCLRFVDASGCRSMTDDCAASLARCPTLTALYLNRCSMLTVAGIAAVLASPHLRRLGVSDCAAEAVNAAVSVAQLSGAAFTDLDVAGCDVLSSSALTALASCSALRRIDLRRCSQVREVELQELLLPSLPWLSELRVTGCRVSVGFARRWKPARL